MPILEPGKTYVPRTAAEIRDAMLTDLRLGAIEDANVSDPPVEPGTDWHVLSSACSQMALLQYANIRIAEDNTDVLDVTGPELDRVREGEGLPEVPPGPSTGSVVVTVAGGGAQTVPLGLQGKLPSGKRFKAASALLGATTGTEVPIVTIDAGSDTEYPPDTVLTWLSPPGNLESDCRVSANDPLTGGTNEEDDDRKRSRILNRRRSVPAGENWGKLIELALNASSAVQYAFVYPALGGPSSRKVVLARDIDAGNNDFTRSPSTPLVELVRQQLHAALGGENETVVQAAADESVDVALTVEIPDAVANGGNGSGWVDAVRWPPLDGGDTKVTITGLGSAYDIRVDASTTTAPIVGQTQIAWWSSVDQRFYTRLITGIGGSAGIWEVTLDQPLSDSLGGAPVAGDYISPASVNVLSHGSTWRDLMRRLGPGENTSDSNRLPRASRRPFISEEWRSDLTLTLLKDLLNVHGEITDAGWSFRSLQSPTVPGAVSSAPNILTLRHFGIYEQ
jgi:uncharacterized phage protein gp47/JayE